MATKTCKRLDAGVQAFMAGLKRKQAVRKKCRDLWRLGCQSEATFLKPIIFIEVLVLGSFYLFGWHCKSQHLLSIKPHVWWVFLLRRRIRPKLVAYSAMWEMIETQRRTEAGSM